MKQLLAITEAQYERSPLHGEHRVWTETNCYVDLWIEVLHALGHDPRPGLAFTLSADFDGDQWQFIKYPLEDLRSLYGLDVAELNPWRGLAFHIDQQLDDGRLITAEVDSWFLPDTAGVAYRIEHVKTSIVPNMIDVAHRRLGYFHGASYYELHGEDFDGVLRCGEGEAASRREVLPPYVERIRRNPFSEITTTAVLDLVKGHLKRRPPINPVTRLAERFATDLPWLEAGGVDAFHLYAFATLRQCGASGELAASLCEWLTEHGIEMSDATDSFNRVANGAKTMQFKLARLAAGRSIDYGSLLADIANHWATAMQQLDDRIG